MLKSAAPFFLDASWAQFAFNQVTNVAYPRNPGYIQNEFLSWIANNSS